MILTILGIIGRILLGLLLLVLVLLLYVIFVPFHYKLSLDIKEESKDFYVQLKDILGLLRIGYFLNDEDKFHLDLLFGLVQIFPKKKGQKEPVSSETETDEIAETENNEPAETLEQDFKIAAENSTSRPKRITKSHTGMPDEAHIDKSDEETKSREEKKDKSRRKKKRPKNKPSKEKNPYIEILKQKENQEALKQILGKVFHLLGRLMPELSACDVEFSTGSPDTTGKAVGVLSMLPMAYGRGKKISPDFTAEDAYLKGQLTMKGKVEVYQILGLILFIFLHKNTRDFVFALLKA